MNTLTQQSTLTRNMLNHMELKGKELYNNNENLRVIANLMEHPEFRKFINKHYDTDIETIILFIGLYKLIDEKSTINLNPYQKVAVLFNLITNPQSRSEIIESFSSSKHQKYIE